jgi:YggT family protein
MTAGIVQGLAAVCNFFISAIQLLVFASIIVSWVGDRNNQIVVMIINITEPIYRPLRRFTRNIPGPFDWAPMIVMAIMIFVQFAVVKPMMVYGDRLMQQEIMAP